MSLLDTNTITVSIQRQTVTTTAGMGKSKAYTTGARGTLPTSIACRLMKPNPMERLKYGIQDEDGTDYLLFQTHPRVDNRDRIIVPATTTDPARTLNVLTCQNIQELDRLWIVSAQESDRGVQ